MKQKLYVVFQTTKKKRDSEYKWTRRLVEHLYECNDPNVASRLSVRPSRIVRHFQMQMSVSMHAKGIWW
jgi:hypothetical protein